MYNLFILFKGKSIVEDKSLSLKQNNSIDLAKFIFAILVVAIHVSPFGSSESDALSFLSFFVRDYLARLAVPFFFITSGYFLFRKTDINNFDFKRSKEYVKKLIKLYLIWSAIYFPLGFGNAFFDEKGFLHGVFNYIKKFIISTSFSHLWYLNALIFAVLVISVLLYKRISPKLIIIFGAVFYFLGLFAQSWFGFIEPLRNVPSIWNALKYVESIIETTRDGLFDGLIFVGIGMLFAYYKIKFTKTQATIGFTVSMILLFIEAFGLEYLGYSRKHDTYLFLVPCAFFLFEIIRNIELPDRSIYKKLRIQSSLIYYIHPWILRLIAVITYLIFKKTEILLLNYTLTLLITLLLTNVIIKLSDKPKGKWLKNLYT